MLRPSVNSGKVICLVAALCLLPVCLTVSAQRWHATAMRTPPRAVPLPLEDMAHMSWTRRNGAPSDISSLVQTKDGYLWIGSAFGLFRFDGLEFRSYPFTDADPRLPASDVAVLAADKQGGLWIGYRMGGISYLRDGKKIDYDAGTGLDSQSTEQLTCRPDGSVWAVADGKIRRFTGSGWETYSKIHGISSEGLFSLFFDSGGNLWTADKGNIYELKKGEDKFFNLRMNVGSVNQFAQLPNGELWISDAWKNARPLNDSNPANSVKIPGVPIMLADKGGSIWLANEFGGLTRIKHPGEPTKQVEYYKPENGLTDGQTRAILQDRQGAIWVGTTRGLDRFRPSPFVPFRGVVLDYYPALAADRTSGIWLHDMDKPLMRLRDGQLSFVSEGHGSSSLFQDSDGSIWMLDQITRDFYRYSESGGAPLRIHAPKDGLTGETWCIGKDLKGNLLASFESHGLWRYDGKWSQVMAPGLPKDSPLSLKRTDTSRVWLGYPHNQVVLDDAGGFHVFGAAQGLAINSVFSFYDKDGLTLAAGSDGLAYYDGSRFHTLQLRTPSLLRGISSVLKDKSGDLWLNAGAGVIRLPQAEWKKAIQNDSYEMDYQLLDEQDGLLSSPTQSKPGPSAVMDKSGLLWFATSGHLVSLDPSLARQSLSVPTVLLQSVIVNDQVQDFTGGERIETGARSIRKLEFDYLGIDLSSPDRVVYQYMLEGQDKTWQQAGSRRQAFYTNLPVGHYSFRVRAATGTGQWSELPTALQLDVSAPFYRTTWFYAIACIPVACLVWLIYGLRLQHITTKMRERLEARAQERVRIARDLHDTLLQGVQGLVLRFHFAAERLPENEPVRAMLRDALDTADAVISEGREKVRELRAEGVSPGDLENTLKRALDTLRTDSAAKISLTVSGKPRTLHAFVQDELYSIGREALTNSVRHAQATHIDLELFYESKQLRLCCRDNGCGAGPEVSRKGFKRGHWGIPGMRERARVLGSTFAFSSSQQTGTRIDVTVAAKKAYAQAASDSWWQRLFSRNRIAIISPHQGSSE